MIAKTHIICFFQMFHDYFFPHHLILAYFDIFWHILEFEYVCLLPDRFPSVWTSLLPFNHGDATMFRHTAPYGNQSSPRSQTRSPQNSWRRVEQWHPTCAKRLKKDWKEREGCLYCVLWHMCLYFVPQSDTRYQLRFIMITRLHHA